MHIVCVGVGFGVDGRCWFGFVVDGRVWLVFDVALFVVLVFLFSCHRLSLVQLDCLVFVFRGCGVVPL